jgi:hypothetical protein
MYTIYHVPGIKVGCSNRVEGRVKDQGFTNFEILEVCYDIKQASERELYWQEKLGYGRDNAATYEQTLKMKSYPAIQKWKKTTSQSEVWKESQLKKIKALHTPEIRAKAIATFKKTANFAVMIARLHTPEIKKKAKERQKELCSVEEWNKKLNNPETKAKSIATRLAKRPGILQYDMEGNFIKEWPGCIEVARETNFRSCQISNCCNGRIKSSHGFIWKYKK